MANSGPALRRPGTHRNATRERGTYNPMLLVGALVGSLFTTLCCIGIAPLISLVVALGLGFIITLTILLPMLIVFICVGGLALWFSYRRHGVIYPLALHGAGGTLVIVLIAMIYHTGPWIWIGMAAIIAATVWNIKVEYTYWHREPEVQFPPAG